mgnify:CR=1 FL=1
MKLYYNKMKIKTLILSSICLLFFTQNAIAQHIKEIEITTEWLSQIEQLSPSEPTVKNVSKKRILVFAKATGFKHWTIPHNIEMLKILAKKSNAFDVYIAYDIQSFTKTNLKKYDAIILNNSNPQGPKRNLFEDLLSTNSSLSEKNIKKEAVKYEQNLINYVTKGGGLMLLHGAIVVQNNSIPFSEMVGGSFDYHPKQQKMHVKEVDVNHPLVKAFKGKGLTHVDEPYFFKNAYFDYNFRPLLYIEANKLDGLKKTPENNINYVSWIKKHGKGRIFYSSPSHNAQSLENPELLQFFLDGMQYVVGDLKADDSPIGED